MCSVKNSIYFLTKLEKIPMERIIDFSHHSIIPIDFWQEKLNIDVNYSGVWSVYDREREGGGMARVSDTQWHLRVKIILAYFR